MSIGKMGNRIFMAFKGGKKRTHLVPVSGTEKTYTDGGRKKDCWGFFSKWGGRQKTRGRATEEGNTSGKKPQVKFDHPKGEKVKRERRTGRG